ncbi:N-acetylmuramoyl-L-alanine amidase [Mucilaginibacter sp. JRF]|uniref:N-acetylmuramoyl-L-alanine amidase n=1 Tax=Mucilaginibacter sp. JRF TaxID=2780088 RepID=UPI00187ECD4A|nr:N-acetylmuramoyl-L-alanine amidase [Mucilaginibacter sp. JRF]MBE9583892.1 N-acetylmuramoyl-L-alanine amidase [Mucilaginibacter sp. JRF]
MIKKYYLYIFLSLFIFATACSPKKGPYAVTNKVYNEQAEAFAQTLLQTEPVVLTDSLGQKLASEWVGTVNFNLRKPNYVVIHYTAQDSAAQTLKTFTIAKTQVSAHYVIGGDGRIYHMLNDYLRAWHGGSGKWGNGTDVNSSSIGIELDNNGKSPFSDAQINSLVILLAHLKKTYNIPTTNFIGHQDLAPTRKVDPGKYFPWKKLAEKGFGYWSNDVLELAPEGFDVATALRLIGYDVSNLNAAISAFKNHFVQADSSPVLSQLDMNVLYNVYQKY